MLTASFRGLGAGAPSDQGLAPGTSSGGSSWTAGGAPNPGGGGAAATPCVGGYTAAVEAAKTALLYANGREQSAHSAYTKAATKTSTAAYQAGLPGASVTKRVAVPIAAQAQARAKSLWDAAKNVVVAAQASLVAIQNTQASWCASQNVSNSNADQNQAAEDAARQAAEAERAKSAAALALAASLAADAARTQNELIASLQASLLAAQEAAARANVAPPQVTPGSAADQILYPAPHPDVDATFPFPAPVAFYKKPWVLAMSGLALIGALTTVGVILHGHK